MEFACDCMCGKLTKRLRILGFDVFYKRFILDRELVILCENENRILLTKDTGILKRKTTAQMYLVKGKNPDEEIVEIVKEFNLKDKIKPYTRCILCGKLTEKIDHEEALHKVPTFVFVMQDNFKRCPSCNKIYWSATHKERMDKLLKSWID